MSEYICVRQNTSLPSYFDVTKFPKHNNLVRKTPGIPKKTFCLRYCEKGSVCFWASPMDLDPYCYSSAYAFSYELDQQYRSLLHFFYTFVKDIDNFHRYNICWKLWLSIDTWKVFGGKVWDISWLLCNLDREICADVKEREETQSASQEEMGRGDNLRFGSHASTFFQ